MEEEYDSPWWWYFANQAGLLVNGKPLANTPNFVGKPQIRSFQEAGGDSLTAISTLLQLRQQGHGVKIEDFLQSSEEKNLERTIENLSNNLSYRRQDIKEIPPEIAQRLLADCFAQKSEIDRCDLTLTGDDYMVLLKRIWPKFLENSFGLIDENGVIRGIATSGDAADLEVSLHGLHPHLVAVFEYLGAITLKAEPHFTADPHAPGAVHAHFLMGTPAYNSPRENVYAMYMMEKISYDDAIAKGFKMSVAQNTSPITQQLAEMFGCKRLYTDYPRDWTSSKGNKPFSSCSPSYCVTVDIGIYG